MTGHSKSGHGEKLGRKREQAIAALLAAPTLAEAAAQAGVSEVTIRRWLKQPEFAERFKNAREDVLKGITTRLRNAAAKAVTTLENVAGDAAQPGGARVSASRAILDMNYKAHELEDLADRLSELERSANLLSERRR